MSDSSPEPLIVECPRCQTRFRAREDQLSAAGGQVRCGVCLALFDSAQAMVAEAPAAETVPAVVDEVDDESPDIPSPDGGPRRWRRTLLVWVGVLVAAWVLAFQLFAYQFDRWSLDPELRFIYQFACGFLGCELPAPPA